MEIHLSELQIQNDLRLNDLKIQAERVKTEDAGYVKFTDYATTSTAGVTTAADQSLLMNERNGKNGELPYVPSTSLSFAVKRGLINGKASWTDEEKAKACETIGALKAFDGSQETGDLRYTVYGQRLGVQAQIPYSVTPKEGALARYASGNSLKTDLIRADNDCTNKAYVDNLPDYLTMTDEQKAKWQGMIGAVGENEITALMEGKFVIATFDIIKDGLTKITLQNLTGMTKIDWGDGTVNNELTHSYKYNPDKAVNGVCKYTCKIYGVTSIGDNAFNTCSSLSSVVIGDSVTSIGGWAFNNCSRLSSVVIPDSVTEIGDYAFCECYSLSSVVIPDSVTSIGEAAFQYCRSLTSVVIGDSVTSIGDYAFFDCYNLTSVEFKSITPTKISASTFSGASLETIYAPNGTSEDYKTKWTENGVTEDVLQLIVEVESDRVAMLSDIKKLYEKLGL